MYIRSLEKTKAPHCLKLSYDRLFNILYSSSVYSCHLFLIYSASVRSIPFLSFIEPIFAWNVPLLSLIFLKRSLVFPILLFSSISLHWSLRKAFLSLLAILWNSAFKASLPNKGSGCDGIPVELFQILKDNVVKVLHSICQQIWKTQQWLQDWEMSVFMPIPKKGNPKECPNYRQLYSSHTLVR